MTEMAPSSQDTKNKKSPRKGNLKDQTSKPNAAIKGAKKAEAMNGGRWTKAEHELFLRGLETHGRNWKNIAAIVKTRSAVQVRTHAQKYFQRLEKELQEKNDIFTPKNADSFYSFRYKEANLPQHYSQLPMVQLHSQTFQDTNSQLSLKQQYFPRNGIMEQAYETQKTTPLPVSYAQTKDHATYKRKYEESYAKTNKKPHILNSNTDNFEGKTHVKTSDLSKDAPSLNAYNFNSFTREKDRDEKPPEKKTGRWTQSEHEIFVLALRTYGREWKKIAEKVKTRTPVQVRTHAQKYLQRINETVDQAMNILPQQHCNADPTLSKYNSTNSNPYFAAGGIYPNFLPMNNSASQMASPHYFPEVHLQQNTAYQVPTFCNFPFDMRRDASSREVDAAHVMLGLSQWIA